MTRLHLVVRDDGLEKSMSRYLVDRISALPNVELHTRTEIAGLEGDPTQGLVAAIFRNRDSGVTQRHPVGHVFSFIGADPNVGWLDHCIETDEKGFVISRNVGSGNAAELATYIVEKGKPVVETVK